MIAFRNSTANCFNFSSRHSFTDRYRYVNFTSANINTGGNKRESFNIKDGIFHVPETGVYLLSVHALPMKGKPCRLQIHHNGNPVADLSNGRKGEFEFKAFIHYTAVFFLILIFCVDFFFR